MTRFIRLAALAALVFPFAASAQTADRGDRAEQRITRLTERLGLTDAQVAIVREEMGEAREGERRRGRRGHSWALAARLAPTMSDAQLEALRTQQETRAEQRRERRSQGERSAEGRRQRAERPDPRADALNLTDAQKQALAEHREAARAEQRSERHEAMADILTEEQQAVLLVQRALDSPQGHRARRGGPRGEHRGRR